jgi:hypothetical protein
MEMPNPKTQLAVKTLHLKSYLIYIRQKAINKKAINKKAINKAINKKAINKKQ